MTNLSQLVAVVDDDESVRRALSRLLRVENIEVGLFGSAPEFLEAWSEGRFACLILDIHLGGMSGLDLLDRLREMGSCVPVIIITAYDSPAEEERAIRGGASAFLRKPLDATMLLEKIRAAATVPHGG
jgi:FixJ family two-component response regulator